MSFTRQSRTRASLVAGVATLCIVGLLPVEGAAQRRVIGGVGLTVFTDPEFRGESATFRDDISDLRTVRLNDEVTSLAVGRGEMWEVCENTNFSGRCQVVSGNEPDLRQVGWSDRISSARRVRNGRAGGLPPNAQRGRIELFSGVGFRGASRTFDGAVPNLRDAGFNDQAMSLRMGPRDSWEVCADANYRNCRVVDSNTPDLSDVGMSTRISSLRPLNRGDRDDIGERGRPGFPGRGRLVLYDQRNFRGQSILVDEATATFQGFNGRAESLQVEGGTWEICTEPGFRGRCTIVNEDANDLGRIGLRNNVGSARPVRIAQRR